MIELLNITSTKIHDRELTRRAEMRREQHAGAQGAEAKANSAELVIRAAAPRDDAALTRLAQLDAKPRPDSADLLVAEIDGEVRAALPLGGGSAIADPFQPTAELVELLKMRAGQLRSVGAAEGGHLVRIWRTLRGAASRPVMAPMAGDVSLSVRHDGE